MTLAPIEGLTTSGVMHLAADVIEENAKVLKECHTLDGAWDSDEEEIQASYEREMALAAELRQRAEEVRE